MQDISIQQELDIIKNQSFAKRTDNQLLADERLFGKKLSNEVRRKISKGLKGCKRSAATRKKISNAKKKIYTNVDIRRKLAYNHSKLSHKVADKIRKEYAKHILKHGKYGSQQVFAKKYKVGSSTISMIIKNKIWNY